MDTSLLSKKTDPAKKNERKKRPKRGQMAPFTREEVSALRTILARKKLYRNLALLNVGIDTMLRLSDLRQLKVEDVRRIDGVMKSEMLVTQMKTRNEVRCVLSPKSQAALTTLIREDKKIHEDYLFTASGRPHGQPMSDDMIRLIVKHWAEDYLGLEGKHYSGHSLRRTKAKFLYQETKNLRMISKLLGHRRIANTEEYLGVTDQDAIDIAHKYQI
jgi:integrase